MSKELEFIKHEYDYYKDHVGWYDDGHKITESEVQDYENVLNSLKALEIIKNCICGEFQLIDNASTDNYFKTPYRFRIYMDEYTYNEWYLRNKEEYDLLKQTLKYED